MLKTIIQTLQQIGYILDKFNFFGKLDLATSNQLGYKRLISFGCCQGALYAAMKILKIRHLFREKLRKLHLPQCLFH